LNSKIIVIILLLIIKTHANAITHIQVMVAFFAEECITIPHHFIIPFKKLDELGVGRSFLAPSMRELQMLQ